MMALSFCSANASDGKTLYFYNWTEYVPPGLLEQFTKETGIKVIYSTYESNESMYAKLKTYKDGAYDLVVPSTYFIAKMSKEGMLQKSTRASSATSGSRSYPAEQAVRSQQRLPIPYIWAPPPSALTATRRIRPPSPPADLWQPQYKGRLLLTDDAREVFQMALLKLGYSGNTTDPKEIEAAYRELQKLMPNVLAFNSDNPGNPFMEGEVNVGMVWNGSAFVARQAARRWRSSGRRKAGSSGWTAWPFRPTRATSRGAEADRLPAAAGNRGAGGGNHRLPDAEPGGEEAAVAGDRQRSVSTRIKL